MASTFFMLPFLFILGTAFGSFFGVLIDRLPQGKTIMGRSHCDFCKRTLGAADLFPVVSFFMIGRRCRRCHKKLSYFYPVLEILTGVLFMAVWLFLGGSPIEKAIYEVIVSTLWVIFWIDLKYQIIPDSLELLLFLFVLLLKLTGGFLSLVLVLYSLGDGLIVMLPILLLYLVTKGRGMGFGDVEFAFNMGFMLGLIPGLAALYIGFVAGGAVGILLLLLRLKKMKSMIAFGPFLIFGTVALLVAKEPILTFVTNIYH